jgi:glycosyltransferase involved in cell wall biosynthesis
LFFPGKTQYETGNPPSGYTTKALINSVNPLSWIKAARYIRNRNPKTVVFSYWMPFFAPAFGIILRLIKRKREISCIALCHNVIPHERKPFDHNLNRFFLKKCDGFITLSKSVLKDLEQFTNSSNKQFTPHPIYNIFGDSVEKSAAIEDLQLNSQNKYLLFFGIVRKYKGLDLLLIALASEKLKTIKNLQLIVAGEFYDDPKEYSDLIEKLGIQDQVVIKNEFIPTEKVKHYFSAADMVVQTYRTATQSGVTQIAYHFNKPMLVTDVGGLAEIVPHKKVGYVVEKDPGYIADAIADFYENNREQEFIASIEKEKDRFSWDRFIEVLEEIRINCSR